MKQILFCLLTGIGVLIGCSSDQIAGTKGGSETTNGVISSLVLPNGSPAVGTTVYLRPADYLPAVSAKVAAGLSLKTLDSTITDSLGKFAFDSIDAGTYMLECLDGEQGNGALIDSVIVVDADSAVELVTDTLKPLGNIAGQIQMPESLDASQVRVLVYGLDRVATPDSLGGYTIPGLAEGRYSLRFQIVANQGIDVHNAMVVSGDTTRSPKAILPGADKIYSPKASGAVNVDGMLDEADWATACAITFSNPAVSENVVTVRTLWDSAFLYIACEVKDTLLCVDATDDIYYDDGIEIFLDPEHDATPDMGTDDLHLFANIRNETWVFRSQQAVLPSFVSRRSSLDDGYLLEIAVSWSLIGKTPADGLVTGIMFANDDIDSDRTQLDWLDLKSFDTGDFKRPNLWGDLVLTP